MSEELQITSEWIEVIKVAIPVADRRFRHRHAAQPVSTKAPEKDANVGNIVTPAVCLNIAHVGCTCQLLERRGRIFGRRNLPYVDERVVWTEALQVLSGGKQLKVFDHERVPTGDIPRQLLKQ